MWFSDGIHVENSKLLRHVPHSHLNGVTAPLHSSNGCSKAGPLPKRADAKQDDAQVAYGLQMHQLATAIGRFVPKRYPVKVRHTGSEPGSSAYGVMPCRGTSEFSHSNVYDHVYG